MLAIRVRNTRWNRPGRHEHRDPHDRPHFRASKTPDALRNYEKVVATAGVAFTDDGTSASLEGSARAVRASGIRTLNRHFPARSCSRPSRPRRSRR